ncbi:MAG: hypothetical protein HOY79_46685 [Streptomyces sp.]|nr:hypothetical protein [Streptomyces sp.]
MSGFARWGPEFTAGSSFITGASDGHLRETYLPAIGDSWSTQDLTEQIGTVSVQDRRDTTGQLARGPERSSGPSPWHDGAGRREGRRVDAGPADHSREQTKA